jgi:hypothetical protein
MRALTAQSIGYIDECEMWFSLAASFWLYFMLHPPEYIKYGSGK